jgi:RES domain-containing protein
MRTWRITYENVALDCSCEGARKSGGHWHREGRAALYTALTVELAVLEKFVHTDGPEDGLMLVAVDLPDNPALEWRYDPAALPEDWHSPEDGGGATAFGERFLRGCSHLYMRVPSTIVSEGVNLVINPEHPAYKEVALSIARRFSFDPRMFGRG